MREELVSPNMKKNGERPPRSRSVTAKPGYRPIISDNSRPGVAEKQTNCTTSTADPIRGHQILPTPEIGAKCDAGNRDSANQSADSTAPLEVECSVETDLHGAL